MLLGSRGAWPVAVLQGTAPPAPQPRRRHWCGRPLLLLLVVLVLLPITHADRPPLLPVLKLLLLGRRAGVAPTEHAVRGPLFVPPLRLALLLHLRPLWLR